jgi:hypothetical protein
MTSPACAELRGISGCVRRWELLLSLLLDQAGRILIVDPKDSRVIENDERAGVMN